MSTDPVAPAHRGAIHDIGYRHYDGPRLGRRHAATSLYLESLRGAYGLGRSMKSKVAPLMLLVATCIPALIIGLVVAITGGAVLPLRQTEYLNEVQVLISIFLAVIAPSIMSRDLRFRVVSLYFSRPLHKVDYVLAKYAAAATALFIYMAAPLIVLFASALLADISFESTYPDFLRAVAEAAVLALVLAGIGLLIAALTPRRGLGVAAIITVLLLLAGAQLILVEITRELGNAVAAVYVSLLSPYSLVEGIATSVLGAASTGSATPDGVLQVGVYVAAALALIAGLFGLLLLRYRRVSVS
ncbi:MAG: rane protein [Thermoleophilia bacterium]|nr:rane protein [Thermoleophilia bacterium]MCZ4496030.1 rane protein [Thermoleophilia bacterium]